MSLAASKLRPLCEQALQPGLQGNLRALFKKVDTAMLNMAERAGENSEQNQHFESAQNLRIVHHEIAEQFIDGLLSPLAANRQVLQPEHDSEHINSLKKLLSVNPTDADRKAGLAAGLGDLQQRLASVSTDIENPLTPAHFIDCFVQSLAAVELDIHSKMLVLRLFESMLYSRLAEYIENTNKALADEGVLPRLASSEESEASEPEQTETALDSSIVVDALADLQAGDYEELEETLSAPSLQAFDAENGVRDLCQELKTQQLLPKGTTISEQEREKIDQVSRLFSYILTDNNLPLAGRAMIAMLQLPYTRIALTDPGFFNDEQNAAKSLLHEITRLTASWQPQADDLMQDQLYQKLAATIMVFLEAERVAQIPCRDLLFDYLMYGEMQRQSEALSSQRLLDSQHSAEHAENIRREVDQNLARLLADVELPEAAQQLIEEGWTHVLYLQALHHGLDSEHWQDALAVVEELIATLQPADSYQNCTELLVRLPMLLKTIREGLSAIELETAEINRMFSALESEHKQLAMVIVDEELDDEALQKAREQARERTPRFGKFVNKAVLPANDTPDEAPAENAAQQEQKTKTAEVEPAPEPEPEPEAEPVDPARQLAMDKLAGLGQGAWLLWNRESGQERCRVAAHIKHTQKYILTNRTGAKIAEFVQDEMLDMLEKQEIETIESENVFERALESVIGDIREHK